MSRPIKLTEDIITAMQEEFLKALQGTKMVDGKVKYEKNLKWDDSVRAQVIFTPMAFVKMIQLIQSFDTEVAWYGVAKRSPADDSRFLISDILVYPQIVTGGTAEADDDEGIWLYSDEVGENFEHLRFQGHSHVNMGTSPSATDLRDQERTINQARKDDFFYIFMIWNKKFEVTCKVFDFKTNTLYESSDVDILTSDEGVDLNAFIADARKKVKRKTYDTVKGSTAAPAAKKELPSKPNDDERFRSVLNHDDFGYEYMGKYGGLI